MYGTCIKCVHVKSPINSWHQKWPQEFANNFVYEYHDSFNILSHSMTWFFWFLFRFHMMLTFWVMKSPYPLDRLLQYIFEQEDGPMQQVVGFCAQICWLMLDNSKKLSYQTLEYVAKDWRGLFQKIFSLLTALYIAHYSESYWNELHSRTSLPKTYYRWFVCAAVLLLTIITIFYYYTD